MEGITTESGQPEAGYQPSMLEEIPDQERRPTGKCTTTQLDMNDLLKLNKWTGENEHDN